MMQSHKHHGFFMPLFDDSENLPDAYSYRHDANVPRFADDKPIIVFDGCCMLCSGWAQTVLKKDHSRRFRLLVAQSALGRALYEHYGLDADDYDTNLLIDEGRIWQKSEACIRMAEGLGSWWRMACVFRVLPLGVRDRLYDMLARNRIRWFGRRSACYVPAIENAERFVS